MYYWPVFDEFRKSYFIGELIWNFADFETHQSKHDSNVGIWEY